MLKKINLIVLSLAILSVPAIAEEIVVDEQQEANLPENVISDFEMEGSLFQQITLLEQDKIVKQLEKERAQLDLELDRLAAEKMKIQLELDTLSGRADQQQQELEVAKAELEAKAQQIEKQKQKLESGQDTTNEPVTKSETQNTSSPIDKKYRLINLVGVGGNLQATLEDLTNGQNKRVESGKIVDGYTIKSISVDEGIVFEKDGEIQTLNIGK